MLASFNAELFSALACAFHGEWCREWLAEMHVKLTGATPMWGDNAAVNFMSKPGAAPKNSKSDARRIAILQEKTKPGGPIHPLKVGTDLNRVDFFTKHLGGDKQMQSMHRLLNTINRVPPLMPVIDKVFTAIELLSATTRVSP